MQGTNSHSGEQTAPTDDEFFFSAPLFGIDKVDASMGVDLAVVFRRDAREERRASWDADDIACRLHGRLTHWSRSETGQAPSRDPPTRAQNPARSFMLSSQLGGQWWQWGNGLMRRWGQHLLLQTFAPVPVIGGCWGPHYSRGMSDDCQNNNIGSTYLGGVRGSASCHQTRIA